MIITYEGKDYEFKGVYRGPQAREYFLNTLGDVDVCTHAAP